jgi:hypothetical protein
MIRPESALFSEETIASFNGKPLLNGFHQQVTPDNYQDIAVGVVMNVHRGEGEAAGFLIGDLMIYDRNAIDSVEMGRTEISIGFEAEYNEIEAGRGEQSQIIGNHVALVDEGRAGPVCSIGDQKPKEVTELENKETNTEEVKTGDAVNVKALGKIAEMFKGFMNTTPGATGGAPSAGIATAGTTAGAASSAGSSSGGGDEETVPAEGLEGRIAKLEATLADIVSKLAGGGDQSPPAPEKDPPPNPAGDNGTEEKPGGDEAGEEVIVEDEMPPDEVVERAEILSPGVDVPEGDAKNTMPSLKLSALIGALKTEGSAATVIKSALGSHAKDVAKAPKALIDAAFRAGSEVARGVNNASFITSTLVFGDQSAKDKKIEHPMSGADLNKIYRDAWAKENGGAK